MVEDFVESDGLILHAEHLVKSYGRGPARNQVLHGVDLAIRRGEFVSVVGPSGCGKSTLLHILGLMDRPDAGRLSIEGRDVLSGGEARRIDLRRRCIGFVFQRFNLLTTISARENLVVSLRVRGLPVDPRAVAGWLDRMGVGHLARRKSGRMSIGEQQRVAVARALAHRPALLLADEPTGCLDSANAESLLDLLAEANAEGQTIIMITHNAEAAGRAQRTVGMQDGRILDDRQGGAQ